MDKYFPLNTQLLVSSLLIILLFDACHSPSKEEPAKSSPALFSLLSPEQTHVDFANTVTEGLNANVMVYEYLYNGGGVAIADVNGDGLQDIYFTGNMTDNKMYVNQGNMRFKDITETAGVAGRRGSG